MYEEDFATMGWDPEDFSTVGVARASAPPGSAPMPGRGRPMPATSRARYTAPAPSRGGFDWDAYNRSRAQRGLPPNYGGQARAASPSAAMVPMPGGGMMYYITEPQARAIVQDELKASLPQWFQLASQVPGAPSEGELMSPLGLGFGTLTNAANVVTLTSSPQRAFRGERLIVALARSAGAATVPVRVSDFKIGENSQLVAAGQLPAETFASDAFGVRLAMSPAAPGIQVVLRVETDVGAVPGGESISVSAAIIGRALWGDRG